MNKLLSILMLSGTLVLGTALATARGGPGFAGHLGHVADEIGLSAEQEARITEIMNAAELASAVDRERAGQIRDELRDMADDFDAGQAQLLADELGAITARLTFSRAESHARVNAVLTEEQREMIETLRPRIGKPGDRVGDRPGRRLTGSAMPGEAG